MTNRKTALFGKESCQRLLTERLTNILFIHDISFKSSRFMTIPPIFLVKNHLPLPNGGYTAVFAVYLFVVKIRYKPFDITNQN